MNETQRLAIISTDPEISKQALEIADEFSEKLAKANPNNNFATYARQMAITADLIHTWQKRYDELAVESMKVAGHSVFIALDRKTTADINRLAYSIVLARLVRDTGISSFITGEQ